MRGRRNALTGMVTVWREGTTMDIDAVYTWVNHTDPQWQEMHRRASISRVKNKREHAGVDSVARYTSRNEIFYSIQSLRKYAPWIRKIYVLSNCQPLDWMQDIPNLVFVKHEDVFPDTRVLPTFNSRAIETVLHKIDGLSEWFLYCNDDFFLCNDVKPSDFFQENNGVYYFPTHNDIPDETPSMDRRPAENREINDSLLLRKSFGYHPKKKLHHAPFPLRRSFLTEIEERYNESVRQTRAHSFRDARDIGMSTTLHAYYAECTGRGRAKYIKARYVDIGDPLFLLLVHPFSPLMRGKYDFLCLNEVTSMKHFSGIRDRIISHIMEHLFG